jgi:hypothetical protein
MFVTLVSLMCCPVTPVLQPDDDPRPRLEAFLRGAGFSLRDRGTDILTVSERSRCPTGLAPLPFDMPFDQLANRLVGASWDEVHDLIGGSILAIGNGSLFQLVTSSHPGRKVRVTYENGRATKVETNPCLTGFQFSSVE